MGVRVNAEELRRQLGRRGLTGSDLAARSGLSPATISHVLGGRSISPRTLLAIAIALEEAPSCPDELVAS